MDFLHIGSKDFQEEMFKVEKLCKEFEGIKKSLQKKHGEKASLAHSLFASFNGKIGGVHRRVKGNITVDYLKMFAIDNPKIDMTMHVSIKICTEAEITSLSTGRLALEFGTTGRTAAEKADLVNLMAIPAGAFQKLRENIEKEQCECRARIKIIKKSLLKINMAIEKKTSIKTGKKGNRPQKTA